MNDLLSNLLEARKLSYDTGRWYHMTNEYFGREVVFEPKKPVLRPKGEPILPRVCVSDTIGGCLVALGLTIFTYRDSYQDPDQEMPLEANELYAYRTDVIKAAVPYHVVDYEATGEHWVLQKTTFKLAKTIDVNDIPEDILDAIDGLYPGLESEVRSQKILRDKINEWLKTGKKVKVAADKWGELQESDRIRTVPAPMNFDRVRGRKRARSSKQTD